MFGINQNVICHSSVSKSSFLARCAFSDIIILVWGTGDASRGVGHSAIAIPNYKEVKGKIKINGKYVDQIKRVFDGTYTVRDLWPGVPAGKSNFAKDLPASYSPNTKGKKFTLEQLMNMDITNGGEGRPADGLIQLRTTTSQDYAVSWTLYLDEQDNKIYNGVRHNCSDYVESALVFLYGNQLSSTEEEIEGEDISITTPNQIYKAAKELPGAEVLKDAGKETDGSSVEAATHGHVHKAAKKAR